MTTPYTIKKSNGSTLSLIYPYESIGPTPGGTGSASTPVQVGCRFDDAIVSSTAGQIILSGNVATLFGVGFKFKITGSSAAGNNSTTFTIATSTYNVGLNQTFVTAAGLLAAATPGTCQLQIFTVAGDATTGRNYYQSTAAFQIADPNNGLAIDNGTYNVLTGKNAVYDAVSGYTAIPSNTLIPASSPFVLSQYQISYNLAAFSVLDMVGQDSLNWGAKVWENMLRMTEHFASGTSPDLNANIGANTPLTGQLWYNTTSGFFEYYNGVSWQNLGNAVGPEAAEVTQIIAGTNITISPPGGTGVVTINASLASMITSIAGTANEIAVTNPTGPAVTLSMPDNVVIPTPSSGTALTVNNSSGGPTITTLISSPFSSASTSPLLALKSTAASGFATLSIAGNSHTPGTNDFALFQNGSNNDCSVLNRANANLLLGTNNTTILTITSSGITVTGTIAASNFSGSSSGINTGNQTITLTGDVTGSGTGSFATTLATALPGGAGPLGSTNTIPTVTFDAKGRAIIASSVPIPTFNSSVRGYVPISPGGTTTFLRADGAWATPPATTGFTESLVANGWQKLPTGLIFNWGHTGSIAGPGGSATITFPQAFASACFSVVITVNGNGSTAQSMSSATGVTATQFTLTNNASNSQTFYWFAVGV